MKECNSMTMKEILQSKGRAVLSVPAETSLTDAVALLAEKRIGALPVLEHGAVIGIFSERDVIYCLATAGGTALHKKVREIMTAPAVTVDLDCPVLTALSLMTHRRIRHLPILDADALCGFVSIGDLVKHRMERIETEAAAMRDYISS
jgi:CBS domain-containing protein